MTSLEELRIKINDLGTPPLYSDATLNLLLSKYTNVALCAAQVLKSIIAGAALGATLSEGAYSRTHNLDALQKLVEQYEKEAQQDGFEVNGEETAYFEIAEESYTTDNTEQIIENKLLELDK